MISVNVLSAAANTTALNGNIFFNIRGPDRLLLDDFLDDFGPGCRLLDDMLGRPLDDLVDNRLPHGNGLRPGLSYDDRRCRRLDVHGRGGLANDLRLWRTHVDGLKLVHVNPGLFRSDVDLLIASLHSNGLVRLDRDPRRRRLETNSLKLAHMDMRLLLMDHDFASWCRYTEILCRFDRDLRHNWRDINWR